MTYAVAMIVHKKKRMANGEARKKDDKFAIRHSPFALRPDMLIADIVTLFPGAESILAQWGLHCVGCGGMALETLSAGVKSHGYTDDDVAELVDDLNRALAEEPERPLTLTITKEAAEGFWEIAEQEGKLDYVLMVTVDGSGGFCMEFQEKKPEDALECTHPDVPALKIFAPLLALKRIGGSTIDRRDGRFKLDLTQEKSACCGSKNSCGCTEKSCNC